MNFDFTNFISEIPENEFIFLDPPYYLGDKSNLYGVKGDLHSDFDHSMLCEMLKRLNRWMLCYNDCEYIRGLYGDGNIKIITTKWAYGMNKTKKSSEIVIIKNTLN